VLTLEDLGGAVLETKSPATPPPPPPAASARPPHLASGVFAKKDKPELDPDAAFAERLISLRPIYTPSESAQAERAVLEIEDLSLRPDNPYLASSLVPPTDKPTSSRALLWGVPVTVLAAIGGWLLIATPETPRASTASSPTATAPASSSETAVPAAGNPSTKTGALAAPAPTPVPEAPIASAPATVDLAVPVARSTPPVRQVVPASHRPEARRVAEAPVASEPRAVSAHVPPGATETAAPDADLPLVPSRDQVAAGFEAVRTQLQQCAAGQHGVAQIAVTIAGTGRISHALVEGAFAGTPAGSCMARTVRAARFPRFSQPSLKVAYPVAF
jgi:hypothetical protein